VSETVSASKKLSAADARKLLAAVTRLVVSKGKKTEEFDLRNGVTEAAVAAMLGPTGNLRAPALRAGKTLLVGFNDEMYAKLLG
jgi:arsenate reductase-like glutaredoxin family protein